MPQHQHRTWAEIHLHRLASNAAYIKSLLSPNCRLMGVIKANAYGHGAVQSALVLHRAGVSWFGVSNLDEAVELRQAGIEEPILVLSYTPPYEAARLAQYRVTQSIISLQHARELSGEAVAAGVQLDVHIKVDTGMSRVGFVCHGTQDTSCTAADIVAACRLPALHAEGIFTHFATADAPDDTFTEVQYQRFMEIIKAVEAQGVTFALRHCCNSAATLRYPEMHFDMVRAGIILYGLVPDTSMRLYMEPFSPVMTLKTTVSLVKELPANTPLSYGCTYMSDTPLQVATVAIGYADGYARALSNRAPMVVHGQRVPVIGRVCMDQCMLDVTAVPTVTEGTEVTVFGRDGVTADELAQWLGTINYEVICRVDRRVPRLYYDGDTLVTTVNYLLDK